MGSLFTVFFFLLDGKIIEMGNIEAYIFVKIMDKNPSSIPHLDLYINIMKVE
jgi:hypothetical protein